MQMPGWANVKMKAAVIGMIIEKANTAAPLRVFWHRTHMAFSELVGAIFFSRKDFMLAALCIMRCKPIKNDDVNYYGIIILTEAARCLRGKCRRLVESSRLLRVLTSAANNREESQSLDQLSSL